MPCDGWHIEDTWPAGKETMLGGYMVFGENPAIGIWLKDGT